MSSSADIIEPWNAVPLTKFRLPRVRADVVARPVLLQRLLESVADNPISLICAPGGSGKTTLLAQLAAHQGDFTALWLSIDADDNDTARLFAALVQAMEPLDLAWEIDPRTLLASIAASRAQMRAALAALVNALCTSSAQRVVLILDDLHRITRPEAFELLDSLIERLPDHVAVVIGTRVEPPLSLARWRAYGELEAFGPDDLKFDTEAALQLAAARYGRSLATPDVQAAIDRTEGWVAGLMLLLQSRAAPARNVRADAADANRTLFSYLAQEVLTELPEDLKEFVLRVSILTELSPSLCNSVTGRSDSKQVLEDLYRRNLFVTALDETTPVLRFHDLFRDFLQAELARRPQLKRELHEKAAQAEVIASRAIHHLLSAQRWDEAMRRIAALGEDMLAQGSIATLEHWIDSIPATARASNPEIAYLRGTCAWFRWDWPRAKRELTPAADGLTAPDHTKLRVRALFHLVDALNSSGERLAAARRIEEAGRLPLDDLGRAELALQRAWCETPDGHIEAVAEHMREFVSIVEQDPATMCAATADRIHCMLIGIPGLADVFQRFFEAYERTRGDVAAPWHISALIVGAWAQLWRGRRVQTQAALDLADLLQHQFGTVRLVSERLAQVKVLANIAMGNHETALAMTRRHIEGMQSAEMAGHGAVWLRPYRHGLARAFWVRHDAHGFNEVLPYLVAPAAPAEWPFVETAAWTARGQAAILARDWKAAETALREALKTHARLRLPLIYADPRVSLAYVLLAQGRKTQAWAEFEPVFAEVVRESAIGLLLLESRRIVDELLDSAPAEVRKSTGYGWLTEQWRAWTENVDAETDTRAGPLAALSERELEVLAEVASGASNKHIARKLSLSLHTVKRHIANILDKLDCDSRGQAADLFRRHS
jgi:LuxR family maltose regulon positive regulatory protein